MRVSVCSLFGLLLALVCSCVRGHGLTLNEETGVLTAVQTLTSTNFEELTSSGLWLLDFYAPWCGHCKRLAPVLDELSVELSRAADTQDNIKVGKIDCDAETQLCTKFGVRGYPTLFVKRGSLERKYVGARSSPALTSYLKAMMGPAFRDLSTDQVLSEIGSRPVFITSLPLSSWFTEVAELHQGHGAAFVHHVKGAEEQSSNILQRIVESTCVQNDPDAETVLRSGADTFCVVDCRVFAFGPSKDSTVSRKDSFEVFVNRYRLGLLPEISSASYVEVAYHSKLTAIVITADKKSSALSVVRDIAPRWNHAFTLCWFKASSWRKFVEEFQITDDMLPVVLVLDDVGQSGHFLLPKLAANPEEVSAFFGRVLDGSEPRLGYGFVKAAGKNLEKLAQVIEEFVNTHPYISIGIGVAFAIFMGYVLLMTDPVPSTRSQQAQYYNYNNHNNNISNENNNNDDDNDDDKTQQQQQQDLESSSVSSCDANDQPLHRRGGDDDDDDDDDGDDGDNKKSVNNKQQQEVVSSAKKAANPPVKKSAHAKKKD